jgi:zinc-binding alcohol dehydrogenase/oxidoreductase
MKKLLLNALQQPLALEETPPPSPQAGQGIVHIKAAALNHRDLWITKGLYANIQMPCVLGSDGAGLHEGRAVVVNPSFNWGDDPRFQGKSYAILGMPSEGTFAEQVAVPLEKIRPMPAHLSFEQAAALPLAGLTAYRALFTKCQARPNDKVLISGVGGGVALFACQFAIALGAKVYVTSGSDDKIEQAIKMGALGGANYRKDGWEAALADMAKGFDVIIDGAAGSGFAKLVKLCAPGARISFYGATKGAITDLDPRTVFWKQISIFGSTMGNDAEFDQMLHFVERHRLVPMVDSVFSLETANDAFARMEKGQQFGKIVLKI